MVTDPDRVDLNLDTLGAFLKQRFPDREQGDRAALAELADELLRFGYDTFGDIESMLDESQEAFEEYEENFPPFGEEGRRFLGVGIVRRSLCHVNPTYQDFLESKAPGDVTEGDGEDDETEGDG